MPVRVPSPGRVRENQRRSRARRREYVHELEQRLRNLERNGVQASTEVQSAAQRVARENELLRDLLNERGVENDSIDAYLRDPSSMITSDSRPVSSFPTEAQDVPQYLSGFFHVGSEIRPPPSEASPQLAINTYPQAQWHNHQHDDSLLASDCLDGQCSRCVELKRSVANRQKLSSESLEMGANEKEFGGSSEDTTACTLAAQIISGMRGHDGSTEIWEDLGCSEAMDCMVKNATLFHVMDRCA